MTQISIKQATEMLIQRKRRLQKDIEKLIDDFESETGKQLREKIEFHHVRDDYDRNKYIALIITELSI